MAPKPKTAKKLVNLQGQPRRVAACVQCGETNDIAAFGQCFKCYRRLQRDKDRERAGRVVDRHSAALRTTHGKLLRAFAQAMAGLSALGLSKPDLLHVRALCEPYLAPIKEFLGGPPLESPARQAVEAWATQAEDADDDQPGDRMAEDDQ
jgi:hypothetical protein